MYENSKLNVFFKITFLGEISRNWTNNLLGINVYRTFESCW